MIQNVPEKLSRKYDGILLMPLFTFHEGCNEIFQQIMKTLLRPFYDKGKYYKNYFNFSARLKP